MSRDTSFESTTRPRSSSVNAERDSLVAMLKRNRSAGMGEVFADEGRILVAAVTASRQMLLTVMRAGGAFGRADEKTDLDFETAVDGAIDRYPEEERAAVRGQLCVDTIAVVSPTLAAQISAAGQPTMLPVESLPPRNRRRRRTRRTGDAA